MKATDLKVGATFMLDPNGIKATYHINRKQVTEEAFSGTASDRDQKDTWFLVKAINDANIELRLTLGSRYFATIVPLSDIVLISQADAEPIEKEGKMTCNDLKVGARFARPHTMDKIEYRVTRKSEATNTYTGKAVFPSTLEYSAVFVPKSDFFMKVYIYTSSDKFTTELSFSDLELVVE
jgi:hypothetical protein